MTASKNAVLQGRFDLPRFYKEAHRILKPGGCLAAWAYYFPMVSDRTSHKHAVNEVLKQLYFVTLGPYIDARARVCEHKYDGA